jgi:hypothetical protein
MGLSEEPCWRLTEVCAVSTLCGFASGLTSVWSIPFAASAAGAYAFFTQSEPEHTTDL